MLRPPRKGGPQAVSLVPASHNSSCANLSDCGNDNVVDGLETFDVGEYHLTSCPICLEHFTLDNPAILLKCEHGFHLQCLESWRQRSTICPMCFAPVVGDEGRIMSPSDARRRRRMRLKAPGDALDAPERSVLIAAAVGAAAAASSSAGPGCEQGDETEVIEVNSAHHGPDSCCGWLRYCCFF
ncbi:hypothetical protein ABB37_10103 [Leptomonas pyrrhocoris]|uniref:RING-type E3 ubiquitin transferase n=1 Tax=Leptomonas pyrrhocoris TaxID=157538 RepID=A0A0N0DQJ8_LEPPY|nr:hypothetical protein ABB37_10103 [Leptomonas pyrrhocoris]KPA73122.1 hypothetical protein ABB37_10103 [Leptomonas pyrrhocoris]|eukprot:XP_015651561.1 hypothetical protein ABB37_10103 [Leptomonas pyrrhocoris]